MNDEVVLKILVPSDGDEMEYVKTITHDKKGVKMKDDLLEYIYTKSSCKLDMILPITKSLVATNIRKGIFKQI
jgi:hypothetical protein